jgi:hypothetical protein
MEHARKSNALTVAAVAGFGLLAGAAAYTFFVRRWHNRWGATDEEVAMSLPGDEIVATPNMNSTRAITINAAPEDIWPWLVQMGKGRGGLYSYDWLDIAFGMLDRPSSEEILPEFQSLREGDVIPIGKDNDTSDDFYVHIVQPERALVIGANDLSFRDRVSWAMVLLPIGRNKTRLLMRVRGYVPMDAKGVVMYALLDPSAFIMLWKQMQNLKRLGERTRIRREVFEVCGTE